MSEVFTLSRGQGPLLVSFPHSGTRLAPGLAERLTEAGRALPDTDWRVPELYRFIDRREVSVIEAHHSRYLVDLNRPADGGSLYPGQQETGLCPRETFDGQALYRAGMAPDQMEVEKRVAAYWRPYHEALAEELERIRQRHGLALLWDAHSIRAEVPRLFEGRLPDFNFGSDGGRTCPDHVVEPLRLRVERESDYSAVVNGRFRGGYITRHYGNPQAGVYAIQLELSQRTHLSPAEPCLDKALAAGTSALIDRLMGDWRDRMLEGM